MASEGPLSGSTFSGANGATGVNWSDPGNAAASDDTRATASLTGTLPSTYQSKQFWASGFGFAVPSGATIDGVVVEVERSCSSTSGSPRDLSVYLFKNLAAGPGDAGADKATGTTWPTSDAYATYGGAADLWSMTLTPTDVNGSGFGVAVSAQKSSGETSTTVRIDHVRITVYYTESGGGGGSTATNLLLLGVG